MHADAMCWLKDRGLFAGPRRKPYRFERQAHIQPGRRQVIDAWCHIRLVECANRLRFTQDAIAKQQVGRIRVNDDFVVTNSDRSRMQDRQTGLAEFMG